MKGRKTLGKPQPSTHELDSRGRPEYAITEVLATNSVSLIFVLRYSHLAFCLRIHQTGTNLVWKAPTSESATQVRYLTRFSQKNDVLKIHISLDSPRSIFRGNSSYQSSRVLDLRTWYPGRQTNGCYNDQPRHRPSDSSLYRSGILCRGRENRIARLSGICRRTAIGYSNSKCASVSTPLYSLTIFFVSFSMATSLFGRN